MSLNGFYWILLGFTGFYWVLPSFTGFSWVCLDFTGFYRVLQVFLCVLKVSLPFVSFRPIVAFQRVPKIDRPVAR